MDDEGIASLLSSMGLNSPQEVEAKLSTMTDLEKTRFIAEALAKKGPISIHEITIKNVKSKPGIPLANIRDEGASPFNNDICCGCGKGTEDGETYLRCTRCKAVYYCTKECQRRDWKGNGAGPTRPRKHKDLCSEFIEANKEFQSHETAGSRLASEVFSSWADQHHKNGSFFDHEFLARKNLLGGAWKGYWARPDVTTTYHTTGKDCHGFQNGLMLLEEKFPDPAKGWTSALANAEFPDDPPAQTLSALGVVCWEDYMKFRKLSFTSIAPLLLTNVLTIYQMLYHELQLPQKKKKLCVYLLGAELELNQIPLFGELAYLLPNVDLELVFVSPSTKAICEEARKPGHGKSLLYRAKDGRVFEVTDPVGNGRVRVKLDGDHEYFHYVPNTVRPDAVMALNAGLGAYKETWPHTMHKILRMRLPFVVSDQTKSILRLIELMWIKDVVNNTNAAYPEYGKLQIPATTIKLNPFHGIVGRDVAAVRVPNINNGYIMTFTPKDIT